MKGNEHLNLKSAVIEFLEDITKFYWLPLEKIFKQNPDLRKSAAGFLVNSRKKIIVYVGNTHIGIEYEGPEICNTFTEGIELNFKIHEHIDSDKNIIENIIGFAFGSSINLSILPLSFLNENLIVPTHIGYKKMHENHWNFHAQDMILCLNSSFYAPPNKFVRIINGFFFDADASGLITRHIKWLDLFPLKIDKDDKDLRSINISIPVLDDLVKNDAHYVYPTPSNAGYKYSKLQIINRFIELWSNPKSSEKDITIFLSKPENHFLLTMKFGAKEVYPELLCVSQTGKKLSFKPDFFLLNTTGFADILEFKLPTVKGDTIVGKEGREAFSAWLTSYIAQTRKYSSYFNDSANREWFEKKYGFKVVNPKRWLVVGRRSDFGSEVWREIMSDCNITDIITYDDLIDTVTAQLYK